MPRILSFTVTLIACNGCTFAQTGLTPLGVLPGGTGVISSHAFAVSPDGRWVVGESSSGNVGGFVEPFRWSATTGMQGLGPLQGEYRGNARGISADGQVVVGDARGPAFRWTPSTGKESLGAIPGYPAAIASAVSHDGTVIVGHAFDSTQQTAFIWTESPGMQAVPNQPRSRATAVSADGRIVVGYTQAQVQPLYQPFIWDRTTPQPQLPGLIPNRYDDVLAFCVSPNGRIIGGGTGSASGAGTAFLWTAKHGYALLPSSGGHCRILGVNDDATFAVGICSQFQARATVWVGTGIAGSYQAYLLTDYLVLQGIPVPPNTTLINADALSANGRVIVGRGVINGNITAYRVEFCYANCDKSSAQPYLNVDDFTCFINKFAAASSLPHAEQLYNYANCDTSTVAPVLNVDDFTCFINRFAQGCQTP